MQHSSIQLHVHHTSTMETDDFINYFSDSVSIWGDAINIVWPSEFERFCEYRRVTCTQNPKSRPRASPLSRTEYSIKYHQPLMTYWCNAYVPVYGMMSILKRPLIYRNLNPTRLYSSKIFESLSVICSKTCRTHRCQDIHTFVLVS